MIFAWVIIPYSFIFIRLLLVQQAFCEHNEFWKNWIDILINQYN